MTNDWNYVALDKCLALLDRLKKRNSKFRKTATFQKQSLDNKLLLKCHTFQSIFVAKNARIYHHLHNACCLFASYVTLKNDCLGYLFCFSFVIFVMDRPRTSTASKMKPFMRKVNSWKSLLLLVICCLAALRWTLGQYLGDSLTRSILFTVFFKFLFRPKGHQKPYNEVAFLSPIKHLWGLSWNPHDMIATF